MGNLISQKLVFEEPNNEAFVLIRSAKQQAKISIDWAVVDLIAWLSR